MALPPVAGFDQLRLSWSAVGEDAVGVPTAAGTVVAVALAAVERSEKPEALKARTVNVCRVSEVKPVTTYEVVVIPLTAADPPAYLISYDVAGGEPAGSDQLTVIAPSLKLRLVPTSVAVTFIGVIGCKKSFCC
jgi:hypothetical protein